MDDVTKGALIGLGRDLLKLIGVLLAAHGVMDVSDWQAISGFILTAAPIAWGIWAKYKAAHNAVVAGARAQATGVAVGRSIAQATAIVTHLSPKPAGQPGKS